MEEGVSVVDKESKMHKGGPCVKKEHDSFKELEAHCDWINRTKRTGVELKDCGGEVATEGFYLFSIVGTVGF